MKIESLLTWIDSDGDPPRGPGRRRLPECEGQQYFMSGWTWLTLRVSGREQEGANTENKVTGFRIIVSCEVRNVRILHGAGAGVMSPGDIDVGGGRGPGELFRCRPGYMFCCG